MLLALDLGTRCGWAVTAPGGTIDSGTWDLKGGRFDGAGMRFLRLRRAVREAGAGCELIVVEEVRRHLGVDAAHAYGGYLAVVQEEAEAMRVPYAAIPVATIKKRATGKGNAGKPDMLAAARAQWPGFTGDDNEADARWLAVVALETLACDNTVKTDRIGTGSPHTDTTVRIDP